MHTVTQVEKRLIWDPTRQSKKAHTLVGTHTQTHSVSDLLLKSNISLTNPLKVLHTTASHRIQREGSESGTDSREKPGEEESCEFAKTHPGR